MKQVIARLRAISARCRSGQPISPDDAAWLGERLEAFLHLQRQTLDEAFGLRNGRGGVPWWMEEAIRIRDGALRELVARHYPTMGTTKESRLVHQLSVRYAASAWRLDKQKMSMPPHYRGTPKEQLWTAFSSGAQMPLSERQLRNILQR